MEISLQFDHSPTPEQLFDTFLYTEVTVEELLNQFQRIKNELCLNDVESHRFFSELKKNFTSWRVTSFMEILHLRVKVKEFATSVKMCKDCNILVIGAGPCGLRFAIDAALCGARVVLVEKRGSFTRNNVLHLWPYLIHDLRNLGIKKLFGKFCAGSLDHISIRRLQLILLKIALVLGVEVHCNTAYKDYVEPSLTTGWRVVTEPSVTSIESTDFNVLVGADGKRNSIKGFQRKEFRAKLAIGITANFVNNNSEDEAKIEEISGVAALFNQKFFADLKIDTDIDLENIVYYKDDTHYFVMTAKKACLLKKGVLKKDSSDVMSLLSYHNVNKGQLKSFVKQAADFSCNLPHNNLAINPDNGEEDVAIFDFTSMYSAQYAAKIYYKTGRTFLVGLVGDGLMEPFWPLGTGCARGFLSCMDLMWMVCKMQEGVQAEDLLRERMSLYQLLHQTSNENMHKKHSSYTIDPRSRYKIIPPYTDSVDHLYQEGGKENIVENDQIPPKEGPPIKEKQKKRKLAGETTDTIHKNWKRSTYARTRRPRNAIQDILYPETNRTTSPETDQHDLLKWCQEKVLPLFPYLTLTDLDSCWRDGIALCGLVYICAPSQIKLSELKTNRPAQNVDLALAVMLHEFGVQPLASDDILPPHGPDMLAVMKCVIELKRLFEELEGDPKKREASSHNKEVEMEVDIRPAVSGAPAPGPAIPGAPIPAAPAPGAFKRRISQIRLRKKTESKFIAKVDIELHPKKELCSTKSTGNNNCYTCNGKVMLLERVTIEGYVFHRQCFRCNSCKVQLKITTYTLLNDTTDRGTFYCKKHFTEILNRSTDKLAPKSIELAPPKLHSHTIMTETSKQRPHSMIEPTTTKTKIVKSPPITEEPVPSRTSPIEADDDPALRIHSEAPKSLPSISYAPALAHPVRMTSRPVNEAMSPTNRAKSTIKILHTPGLVEVVKVSSPSMSNKRKSPNSDNSNTTFDNTQIDLPPQKPLRTSQKVKKTMSFDSCPQENMPLPDKKVKVSCVDISNVTTRKKHKKLVPSPQLSKKEKVKLSPPKSKRSLFFKKYGKANYALNKDMSVVTNKDMSVVSNKDMSVVSNEDMSVVSNKDMSVVSNKDMSVVSNKDMSVTSNKDMSVPIDTNALLSRSAHDLSPSIQSIASGVKGRPVNSALHGARVTSRPPPTGLNSGNVRRLLPTTEQKGGPVKIPVFGHHNRVASMDDMNRYFPSKRDKEDVYNVKDTHGVKDKIAMYSKESNNIFGSDQPLIKTKLAVTKNLTKSVLQDTKRLHNQRTNAFVEVDTADPVRQQTRKHKPLRMNRSKKDKKRLEQAQQIQRDKSMLEEQMNEFEKRGATIERKLRDDANNNVLMGQFLELVNIKNDLMRKENELLICEKYLQLLDDQDQLDRDLRYSMSIIRVKSKDEIDEEERMILKKFDVVNKRDCLLMQLDEDKRREQEEDDQIKAMLNSKGMFGNTQLDITPMTSIYSLTSLLSHSSDDDEMDGGYNEELTLLEESDPTLIDTTAQLNIHDEDTGFFSFKKLKNIFN